MFPSVRRRILQDMAYSLLILGYLLTIQKAHANLEAVELTHVPHSILAKCPRTFFASSNPEERALYVTPHVVAGRSPIAGGDKEVFIDPTEKEGIFRLAIGIFFPADSGNNSNFYEMRDAQANYCNFEAVRSHLNQQLGSGVKPYGKIVHMPVNAVFVTLPTLNGRTIKASKKDAPTMSEGTTIFEYVDRSFLAEYEIDEQELEEINMDLSRGSGLSAVVSFVFESRQNDGEVSLKVDAQSVKSNFEAQASGKPPFMGKAEVKAMLQSAVNSRNIETEVKGGITESSEHAIDNVLDRVLGGIEFNTKAVDIPPGDFAPTKGDSDYVNVSVVAEAIVSQLSERFRYRRSTAAIKTEVEIPVNIRSRPIDPYVKEVRIRDGFNPVAFPENIQAGESIRISPGHAYQVQRYWGEHRQYLTVGQISDLGLDALYPFMHDSSYEFSNIETSLGAYAVARECGLIGYSLQFLADFCSSYKFLRIQRYPMQEVESNQFDYAPDTLEKMADIPMYVSFSQVDGGQKKFTLAGLLYASDNDPDSKFLARIESESIVLDAVEDLGVVRFSGRFKKYKLQDDLRDEVNNNDSLSIYSTSPEHPEECREALAYGGSTDSCQWPAGVLLVDHKREDGSYIFSYRSDRELLDEAVIDYHWGWGESKDHNGDSNRMDEKAKRLRRDPRMRNQTTDDSDGLAIQNRIDNEAIKSYRAFLTTVSWPYPTPYRDQRLSNEETQSE